MHVWFLFSNNVFHLGPFTGEAPFSIIYAIIVIPDFMKVWDSPFFFLIYKGWFEEFVFLKQKLKIPYESGLTRVTVISKPLGIAIPILLFQFLIY